MPHRLANRGVTAMLMNLLKPKTYNLWPLTDWEGRTVVLSVSLNEASAYYLRLSCRGYRVGYAYCSFDGRVIRLNDIQVDATVILPPRNLLHAFWRKLVKPKSIHLRKQGLGTAMLRQIIREARARGAERIVGSVTPDDRERNPKLLTWYIKHGFAVVGQSAGAATGWLDIVYDLSCQEPDV